MSASETTMHKALEDAIREVETLPEADQEELAQALQRMALRKQIDAKLAKAEARGGSTPHEQVLARLKSRNAG
jgi:hypothetical protein